MEEKIKVGKVSFVKNEPNDFTKSTKLSDDGKKITVINVVDGEEQPPFDFQGGEDLPTDIARTGQENTFTEKQKFADTESENSTVNGDLTTDDFHCKGDGSFDNPVDVPTPTADNHATNKKYVDDKNDKKQDLIDSTHKLDYSLIDNTPTIPDKTSDLTNDSGFIDKDVDNLTNYSKTSEMNTELEKKLDKSTTTADTTFAYGYDKTGQKSIDMSNYIPTLEKGANNGVASLDSTGKIFIAQLPDGLLNGMVNGGTVYHNTTTSVNECYLSTNGITRLKSQKSDIIIPTGDKVPFVNDVTEYETDGKTLKKLGYDISVGLNFISESDFSVVVGSETVTFEKGDWLISLGNAWAKIDNTDAVVSVNGKIGIVILGAGDIKMTDGTTLQVAVSKKLDMENTTDDETYYYAYDKYGQKVVMENMIIGNHIDYVTLVMGNNGIVATSIGGSYIESPDPVFSGVITGSAYLTDTNIYQINEGIGTLALGTKISGTLQIDGMGAWDYSDTLHNATITGNTTGTAYDFITAEFFEIAGTPYHLYLCYNGLSWFICTEVADLSTYMTGTISLSIDKIVATYTTIKGECVPIDNTTIKLVNGKLQVAQAEYITLTGTSGTLTPEQLALIGNKNNYINKDNMLFECVYYSAGVKAVYSIGSEAKNHILTVTLPAGTWTFKTYELLEKITTTSTNDQMYVKKADGTNELRDIQAGMQHKKLTYDGTKLYDGTTELTFAALKTLVQDDSLFVTINYPTMNVILYYQAYESDAIWFNSRYKIDGISWLQRFIMNSANAIIYDDDPLLLITGTTNPTTSTKASIGTLYQNTANGTLWQLEEIDISTGTNLYVWKKKPNLDDIPTKTSELTNDGSDGNSQYIDGLFGTTNPTTATKGYFLGQIYTNKTSGKLFRLKKIDGTTYTWKEMFPIGIEDINTAQDLKDFIDLKGVQPIIDLIDSGSTIQITNTMKLGTDNYTANWKVVHATEDLSNYGNSGKKGVILQLDGIVGDSTNEYKYTKWDTTNNFNYDGSLVKTFINGDFVAFCDTDFTNVLKSGSCKVGKSTDSGASYSLTDSSFTKFFLPSAKEVMAFSSNQVEDEGEEWLWYKKKIPTASTSLNTARVKSLLVDGNTDRWWLRSPRIDGTDDAFSISHDGNLLTDYVNSTYFGVAPACLIY